MPVCGQLHPQLHIITALAVRARQPHFAVDCGRDQGQNSPLRRRTTQAFRRAAPTRAPTRHPTRPTVFARTRISSGAFNHAWATFATIEMPVATISHPRRKKESECSYVQPTVDANSVAGQRHCCPIDRRRGPFGATQLTTKRTTRPRGHLLNLTALARGSHTSKPRGGHEVIGRWRGCAAQSVVAGP